MIDEPAESALPMVSPRASQTLATPLFVVGSPRSGTSILTSALLAAGYHGFREGNFLTLMRIFDLRIDQHIKLFAIGNKLVMASVIDWDAFRQDIRAAFKKQVDTLNPVQPWMDKTGNPEMIEAMPHILQLWPNARFIFAKRRGVENIISRMVKFPGLAFEYHCRDWARNMAAWRAMRTLPGLHALEVDQQDISRNPDRVAAELTQFLNCSPEKRDLISKIFSVERPQQSDDGSASRVIALENAGWTSDQMDIFMRVCWPEMELYGYSVDAGYWTK